MARIRRLTLAMLCTTAGGLLLCGTPTQAAITRELIGSFGPAGPGTGGFGEPRSIAVDQTTGDVYVYDFDWNPGYKTRGDVYKFNAAGAPVDFSSTSTNEIEGVEREGNEESQIAVDSSKGPDEGDIYVANGTEVAVYAASGVKLGTLAEDEAPCGVAVDPSGEVYVAIRNFGDEKYEIKKYTPVSNPVTTANYTSSLWEDGDACIIATDSAGDIYASNKNASYQHVVTKFDASQFNTLGNAASGTLFDKSGGTTLAVDPADGDVYIDDGLDVAEYEASGKLFGSDEISSKSGGHSYGVAVSDSSDDVYVGPGGENVEVMIFGAPFVTPEVTTETPTGVTTMTATLNGSVNPEGLPIAQCEFEYGTGAPGSYGHTVACEQTPIEGSEPVSVSAILTGLAVGTSYHYRLVVSLENGKSYDGLEKPFTSLPAVQVNTEAATGLTRTTAALNGSVNPKGLPIAQCEFEYGTGAPGSYGHTVACEQTPIEGSEPVPVSANLAGLAAGTSYHYRLVVSIENGESYDGLEELFTSLPAVEGVSTAAASEVEGTSATLNGSLEPNGVDTHYFFEYGETASHEYATTREDAGDLNEVKQVSASITGLEPNKSYSFRLVAENSFGTTRAPHELQFKTVAVAPVVHALAAEVTSTTAVFLDTLNPENGPTKYHFEYGPTKEYGQSTPEVTLASSFGEDTVDGGVISELQPETTLYYRLIATNGGGTSEGPAQILRTSPATPPMVVTAGASNVSQNTATISGNVSTNGLQTSYGFEVGTEALTEAREYVPATGLGSLGGATTETVTLTLGELQPGTIYYYRVLASSVDGTSYGADQTFTTTGFPTLLAAPLAPSLIATPTIVFPTEVFTSSSTTKTLTRAQELAKALKACKKGKRGKRAACERQARKKYGPAKKKSKKKRKG